MTTDVPKNQQNSELEGDPEKALAARIAALHEQACSQGERFYLDPVTQYWVTTRCAHLERGYCCGNGCRHCPWNHEAVRNPPGSRIGRK